MPLSTFFSFLPLHKLICQSLDTQNIFTNLKSTDAKQLNFPVHCVRWATSAEHAFLRVVPGSFFAAVLGPFHFNWRCSFRCIPRALCPTNKAWNLQRGDPVSSGIKSFKAILRGPVEVLEAMSFQEKEFALFMPTALFQYFVSRVRSWLPSLQLIFGLCLHRHFAFDTKLVFHCEFDF